ncbi:NUDIX hydrolase [Cellulomonas xiejunii]|uniref:NUDIX hydrolase n=1 Tax=Cellulomonas xiejunii TaxID=2968083 RepID=UPI0027E074EA|nr:NUDIX hydrolase [Cellulomonas xiejunii]
MAEETVEFTEYDTRLAAYAVVSDGEHILLTWFNGSTPSWTLPGGGVEFHESVEEAVVREVREETGYEVELDAPLTTHSFTRPAGDGRRPVKSVRVLFGARVVGGELGTTEVGGTTDFAAWVPLDEVPLDAPTPEIVRLAVEHVRRSPGPTGSLG